MRRAVVFVMLTAASILVLANVAESAAFQGRVVWIRIVDQNIVDNVLTLDVKNVGSVTLRSAMVRLRMFHSYNDGTRITGYGELLGTARARIPVLNPGESARVRVGPVRLAEGAYFYASPVIDVVGETSQVNCSVFYENGTMLYCDSVK